nr:MAG TPA: hypothetical protein [Caudoviricetes sp.]
MLFIFYTIRGYQNTVSYLFTKNRYVSKRRILWQKLLRKK